MGDFFNLYTSTAASEELVDEIVDFIKKMADIKDEETKDNNEEDEIQNTEENCGSDFFDDLVELLREEDITFDDLVDAIYEKLGDEEIIKDYKFENCKEFIREIELEDVKITIEGGLVPKREGDEGDFEEIGYNLKEGEEEIVGRKVTMRDDDLKYDQEVHIFLKEEFEG